MLAGLFAYYVSTTSTWRSTPLEQAFLAHYGFIQLAYVLIAVLVFWLFLYWPLRACLRIRVRIFPVMAATFAMLALPLAASLLDLIVRIGRHQLISRYDYYAYFVSTKFPDVIATTVVAFIGASLLDQITYVGIRLSRNPTLLRFFNSPKRFLTFGLFLVLSIPLTGTLNSSVLFEDASALTTLALHIDDLLPYLLALGCILFLRELNRPDVFGFPRKETLRIGALLFAFFLAGRTTNLLFIPVPLLLGWWLFRYFAVRPENPSQPAADMVEQIRAFLNYRRSTPILNDLRSAVENKFRKAEISLADYKEKLSEVDGAPASTDGCSTWR